jgi:CcmD family protein
MATNFWWLFAAYTIVWGALFAYVASLAGRLMRVQRELDGLRRRS